MPDRDCGPHCPFLNRSDSRCSDKFSLDHLQHAFEHCFGEYKACSVYRELLDERQERRLAAAFAHAHEDRYGNDAGGAGRFGGWVTMPRERDRRTSSHATHRLVQVTVSPGLAQLARGLDRRAADAGRLADHHAERAAGGPLFPAASRF